MPPSIENDDDWANWRDAWSIRPDTIYLNHGSFGPSPRVVQQCQMDWQQQLASQPMDFFVRHFEPAWLAARKRLAEFVGVDPECLVFMENSTAAMNTVASSLPLPPGDEVLLTDHEYGAVGRIWRRACQLAGTVEPRIAKLPSRFESADMVIDAIFRDVTDRTRCLVVSHVTSPTAVILPVQQICVEAKRRGISVCVDGPHAPAQIPLVIDELGCDFYTASLHKWVSAPLGSGFLFVAPQWHERIKTPQLSWGRLAPAKPIKWWEEFVWPGTRDPSAYLGSEAAIDFLEGVGLPAFRAHTHNLARYARQCLVDLTGLEPATPDDPSWYGSMVSVPLPPGDAAGLQCDLWQSHGIEVPVIERGGRRSIRVSCHLYNNKQDIDSLVRALGERLSSDK
jgi:isopenicillin-N epimerase